MPRERLTGTWTADYTLRELALFVTLAEERQLRRAARRLGMAPSSVTEALRRLEHKVAGELFGRTRRPLILTRTGRELLPAAREVLAAADEFGARVQRAAMDQLPVRIGVDPRTPRPVRRRVYAVARSVLADSEVTAALGTTEENLQLLAERELDCALVWAPLGPSAVELVTVHHAVFDRVVLAAGHRLSRQTTIAPRDLAGETWIAPDRARDRGTHDRLRAWWLEQGVGVRVEQVDVDLPALGDIVLMNGGFFLCPSVDLADAQLGGNVAVALAPAPCADLAVALAPGAGATVRAFAASLADETVTPLRGSAASVTARAGSALGGS